MYMSFKKLSEEEEAKFRHGAIEDYKPFTAINGMWHPVYQDECIKINSEWQKVRILKENARKSYKPFTEISGMWPLVYQQECVKINLENSIFVEGAKVEEDD